MNNFSICDKVSSFSTDQINSDLCCEKNGNNCLSYSKSGNRCQDTQTLTRCSDINELAKSCKREDNLANYVCRENNDKLFCLSIPNNLG